jgi:dGTP triphosphohydrolase
MVATGSPRRARVLCDYLAGMTDGLAVYTVLGELKG